MKITDEMLFEHAAEARDIWLSTLPVDEDIPDIQCSKAFEKKMQKLIKEQQRTPRANSFLRNMKQTIAVALAIILISFGGLMTVEACRTKVIEVVVRVFHDLTEYCFSSEKTDATDIVLPDISFDFVPSGMQEVENRITTNNRRRIIFEDDDDKFFELTQRFITSDGSHKTILDTEDSSYTVITIGGDEAYLNVKDEVVTIIWTENDLVYKLYGILRTDEMVKIAENIQIIEK